MLELNQIYLGDCLDVMNRIDDNFIDMILADPPYGTTACRWDAVIPLEPMWEYLKRIIKRQGAIVMTASQPFTTILIYSNLKMFKYCWVWEKDQTHSPLNAKYQPLKVHEDIVVFSKSASTFSKKGSMIYNPQMTQGEPYPQKSGKNNRYKPSSFTFHTKMLAKPDANPTGLRYPRSVIKFVKDRGLHPTQKPVAMMEYLIKTYTNEGNIVLDFAAGSGTTGIACQNLNRNFILIEKDDIIFKGAYERLNENKSLIDTKNDKKSVQNNRKQ